MVAHLSRLNGMPAAPVIAGRGPAALGVEETEAGIKNKVSRGRFTLVFFLLVMVAIGADWIQVPAAAAIVKGEGFGDT